MKPRRALLENLDDTTPRRAIVEPCAGPRRALTEVELVAEPTTQIMPRVDARAFVNQRRRFTARKLIAAAGLVAMAGSFSGVALATSSANPLGTPTASVIEPTDRTPALSRSGERAPLTEPTSPAADLPQADPSPEATPEEPVAEEPAVEEVDIAGTIAPGQHAARSVEEAIATAESMVGNWGYDNMCLSLVATFYGYTSAGVVGAQQAADEITAAGQMNTDLSDIPVGALIWYDGTPVGNPYGHVAMYAGDGMVYSNGAPTGVGLIPLHEPADGWGEPIIGWSSVWLPAATV